jgi:hypothetical protein
VDEIHNENDHNNEENCAEIKDDQGDGLGNTLSNVLGSHPSKPKATTQSEIVSM